MSRITLAITEATVSGESGLRKLVARADGLYEIDEAGAETRMSPAPAIAEHVAETDPHPQYTTGSELATAAAAVLQAAAEDATTKADAAEDASAPIAHVGAGAGAHANAVAGGAAGFITGADKTKLDGVATGATANSTDAELRDRATHTGEQPIATVTGLQDALDDKVDTGDERLSDARQLAAGADKTKLDAISPGATANDTDADLRDRTSHTGEQPISTVTGLQAALDGKADDATTLAGYGITDAAPSSHVGAGAGAHANAVAGGAAGFMTGSDKTKLGGVATGATANSTDAQLRDRTTHTGAQAISTVTGLQAALDGKADDATTLAGYGITDATPSSHVGAGGTAHANAVAGGAAGFMSGADKTKLDGVATGATANDTDANLKARANHTGVQPIATVTDLQATLDAKIPATEKGAANGVATLDGGGKVAAAQLPSYVDDVLEYANLAAFPATGETGKIYVSLDANKTYRWSGSVYVEISASPGSTDAVTEGSTNLYFTAARVLATVLAGLSTATNAVITGSDTVLWAFGKMQKQISDNLTTLSNHMSSKDASGGFAGLTLFNINSVNNAGTITSLIGNAATAARAYLFPDKNITVAGLQDFAAPPAIGNTTPAAGTFTSLSATVGLNIDANTSNPALRVTQIGAGVVALFEDSASTDISPTVITANGVLVSGHTSSTATVAYQGSGVTAKIQNHGTALADSCTLVMNWATTASAAPTVIFAKSRSGTIGTHAAVIAGTDLGAQVFEGSDGTAFVPAAVILAESEGTISTGVVPGVITITTANAAGALTEGLRINSNQVTSIAGAALNTQDKLQVLSSGLFTGPVKHGQYTLATLPSASAFSGYLIDVTDATGGSKVCRSNGTNWQLINTTTTVS